MTDYTKFNTTLTKGQINKMKSAKKRGSSITITISNTSGPHELMLTKSQIDKISKRVSGGKGIRIKMSETQMKNQTGGFLGALLSMAKAALPTIAKTLGTLGLSAASGAISGATQKATSGSGIYRKDGFLPLKMNKNTVDKVLKSLKTLEELRAIQKGSLNKAMKGMEGQNGGFVGTLLATLAGPVLPGLIQAMSGNGLFRKGDGLIQNALGLPNGKIPILGDIPLLGAQF